MKTVQIPISDLLRVLEKMSNDNENGRLLLMKFLTKHLEAYTKDGQGKVMSLSIPCRNLIFSSFSGCNRYIPKNSGNWGTDFIFCKGDADIG